MKILVTGALGMLGRDLVPMLLKRHDVVPVDRADLDITDRDAVFGMIRDTAPDVLINCAAFTNVEGAEDEIRAAYAVNAFGAQNLALACEASGCSICHVSTDYVFDGSQATYGPFDHAAPLNVYGESKLAGEKFIQWATGRFHIVRTSWLYGRHGVNFVEKILERAGRTKELRVVSDQVGAPTWTVSLAGALCELVERKAYGVFHFSDDAGTGVSWHEFAVEILKQTGMSCEVRPVSSSEFPTKAVRPARSTLDCTLIEMLGIQRVGWKDALHRYLGEQSRTL